MASYNLSRREGPAGEGFCGSSGAIQLRAKLEELAARTMPTGLFSGILGPIAIFTHWGQSIAWLILSLTLLDWFYFTSYTQNILKTKGPVADPVVVVGFANQIVIIVISIYAFVS